MKCNNSSFTYAYCKLSTIYTNAEITLLGVWEFISALIVIASYVLVTLLIIRSVYYVYVLYPCDCEDHWSIIIHHVSPD